VAVAVVRRRPPERVAGVVALSVGVPFIAPPHPYKDGTTFDQVLDSDEGWAKLNRHYWRRDYPGFVEFFFAEMLPEPHSTSRSRTASAGPWRPAPR
jgi:hypothetical protein